MDPALRHALALAREHYEAGELELAEPHLLEVLKANDGFADLHNMVGVIRQHRGQPEVARQSFERALEINPRYTDAALNLAVCFTELGLYDEAKEVYAKAAEARSAAPESTAEGDELDDFARGKIANLHGDLGAAYRAVGMLDSAIDEYDKALKLCPHFVDVRTKMAETLRDVGQTVAALSQLERVRDEAPGYLPGRLHLGVTLWSADRRDEARREWKAVLEADPDNRSAKVYLAMRE